MFFRFFIINSAFLIFRLDRHRADVHRYTRECGVYCDQNKRRGSPHVWSLRARNSAGVCPRTRAQHLT